MSMNDNKQTPISEIELNAPNGLAICILFILLYLAAAAGTVFGGIMLDNDTPGGVPLFVLSIVWLCIGWFPFRGVKVLRPNEALVLTLFGKYSGTLKHEGIFYVNPFLSAVGRKSDLSQQMQTMMNVQGVNGENAAQIQSINMNISKKLSLKATTLNNAKQKINDLNGNPVEVKIVVIWKIADTAKAVFAVDDYMEYISIQADSTLRDVACKYPYDSTQEGEKSLRSSSAEIAESLKTELQKRVALAGIDIIEARITHLAYAPEIASVMLQRQQAAAIIDARQKIVDGAVGMVEMALDKLSENNVCELDEERKAHMVSNLLVVLCGNKDAQPIVNSGTLY